MYEQADKFAIAALVCGILGLVGGFLPVIGRFTFVLAILGIVFGAKARPVCSQDKRGLATAGMVLGIIGTAFGVIGLICFICAGTALVGLGLAAA